MVGINREKINDLKKKRKMMDNSRNYRKINRREKLYLTENIIIVKREEIESSSYLTDYKDGPPFSNMDYTIDDMFESDLPIEFNLFSQKDDVPYLSGLEVDDQKDVSPYLSDLKVDSLKDDAPNLSYLKVDFSKDYAFYRSGLKVDIPKDSGVEDLDYKHPETPKIEDKKPKHKRIVFDLEEPKEKDNKKFKFSRRK